DAILQIGLPGGYGFYGVADILSGDANPSGHLTNIYAVDNSNSPAAQNYGDLQYTNANSEISMNSALVEAEGIYTGYKYYETRYTDTVLGLGNANSTAGSSTDGEWTYNTEVSYPFGYGLSYTTFEQKLNSVNVDLESRTVTVEVAVTNTGSVAGKNAVQLYVSLPYTEYDKANLIEKASIQLLDYGKTEILQPGESVTLTLTADAQDMASWDSGIDNIGGTKGSYILDDGTYYFTVGNGSNEANNNILATQGYTVANGMTSDGDASNVLTWELNNFDKESFAYSINGTLVENQLEDLDLNYYMPNTVTYLTRNDWEGTFPITYKGLTATDEMLEILDNDTYEITANGNVEEVTFNADNGLVLADLKGETDIDSEGYDLLLDQISLEEAMIRTGFGGTSTKAIPSIMSPEVIQNDGPNGIYSYTLGQYANFDSSTTDPYVVSEGDKNLEYKFGTMTNETVIAQTFNKDIAKEYGQICGNYSLWANLTIYWGAGTNLHRLPYNARNHEYYSEDPVLTAGQGSNFVSGGLEYGLIIAPKHLAFNDTEVNRTGVSVFMTEQKARETELRGTQSCIEDAGALGLMSAFNRVGITNANSHIGLLTNILRKEWGFKGLLSQDFIMNANYVSLKESVINGVTMSCNTGDNTMAAVSEKYTYWTVENVSVDATLLSALKQVMLYQNYAIANSNAMDGLASNSYFQDVRTWYDNLLTGSQILFALLTLGALVMYFKKNGKEQE
ncbi:MAG: glycoside hydrolase family 3 N-terminal domain-containing protein, partial [Coprobacillaceae bacterium]